jgi:hypothetical protein
MIGERGQPFIELIGKRTRVGEVVSGFFEMSPQEIGERFFSIIDSGIEGTAL